MFTLALVLTLALLQSGAVPEGPARPPRPGEVPLAQDTTALVHVNVIPMDRERLLMRRTLIIAGGKILALGHSDSVKVPPGIRTIDGGDSVFVLPGLADMHSHIRYENDLALLLANGVTTTRNMRGTAFQLTLRRRIADGSLLGPRLYTAGVRMNGTPQTGATPAEARALVAEQAKAGFDFIKVYDGLSKASYAAVVAEARRWGLPVAGHVPDAVGVLGALAAGQASIEHAEQVVNHYFGDDFDPARVATVPRAIAAAGTYVTPTLEYISTLELQWDNPDSLMRRPDIRYLDPETYAFWRTDPGHNSWYNHAMEPLLGALVRGFRDAGVKILAGTDFYIVGNVAGFALHRELQSLVDAGLTPYQALETATRNPAEFLHDLAHSGTVAQGKVADLVLVVGNPLVDIGRTSHVAGIVLRGRWLSGAELRRRVDSLAQAFRGERELIDRLLTNGGQFSTTALDSAPAFQSSSLNQVGYRLLGQGRKDDAVAVFELVTRRYPASGGAFDSLGDGYSAAGRKQDAIMAFDKALQLDPSQDDTRRKLAALRAAP
ncbi:MAG: amidohydrolase family protein [Gammaproteobacteria bacterium]